MALTAEQRTYNRDWKRRHKEQMREQWQSYHAKNKDKINAKKKEYRENNKEKLSEYFRWYRQTFPEKRNHLSKQRSYQKKQAGAMFTLDEWTALKTRYNHQCLSCLKFEPEVKLTADHVIPLSQGGTNSISNIQPLCHACNSSKHTKIIDYRLAFEKTTK